MGNLIALIIGWLKPSYNTIGTRRGRLATFFLLYLTEGIPQGFVQIAMITQMRTLGVESADIGKFAAALTLPWAFKWIMGPIVDLFFSNRLGRRRGWIVFAQMVMCLTLLMAIPIDCGVEIKLLSLVLVLHNIFAATQDVAIDALACQTLKEDERGIGNGLMFAGAYAGNFVGGTCVLWLMAFGVPFNLTFLWTIATILVVTLLVSLRIREPHQTLVSDLPDGATRGQVLTASLKTYIKTAIKAFFGSKTSIAGLFLVLLPNGAFALCCALSTNLNVEMGMSLKLMGNLALVGSICCGSGCVVGGLLADKYDRRLMLGLASVLASLVTLVVAYIFWRENWIYPILPGVDSVKPSQFLLWSFIILGSVYGFFQGLTYGTKMALMMDVCNPAVAATQFTAYMALSNLVLAYSNLWQCGFVKSLGYPTIFTIDACMGVLCLFVLPFMPSRQKPIPDILALGPEAMLEVAKV
jgi:PAT family beta-lactamase induction signal transducer AmpG